MSREDAIRRILELAGEAELAVHVDLENERVALRLGNLEVESLKGIVFDTRISLGGVELGHLLRRFEAVAEAGNNAWSLRLEIVPDAAKFPDARRDR